MNNAPKYPTNAVVVAGFIAAYYATNRRYVVADYVEIPTVTVYESHAEYGTHDPSAVVFAVRERSIIGAPSDVTHAGFDVYAVDPDGTETWHAHVVADFDYAAVADACENGVAFD